MDRCRLSGAVLSPLAPRILLVDLYVIAWLIGLPDASRAIGPVPQTVMASFFLVSHMRASMPPKSSVNSAASGSARGYQELFVPLAIPATVEQAVRLDHPHDQALCGRRAWVTEGQTHNATVSVSSRAGHPRCRCFHRARARLGRRSGTLVQWQVSMS
jgi:hypothetical protein